MIHHPKQRSYAISTTHRSTRKPKINQLVKSVLVLTSTEKGNCYSRIADGKDQRVYFLWTEKHRRHAKKNPSGTYWLSRVYAFDRDALESFEQRSRSFVVKFK